MSVKLENKLSKTSVSKALQKQLLSCL